MVNPFPKFHRYVAKRFAEMLFIVTLFAVVGASFITLILFLNLAKVKLPSLVIDYTLSSVLLYVPGFFGLLVLVALGLTAYNLLKQRLSMVLFSLGISPKVYLSVFLLFGLIFSGVSLLYFEYLYPRLSFLKHVTYLKSKKKEVKTGIVQDFWYRKGNLFINVDFIKVSSQKAYNGRIFEVDNNFNTRWIVPFKEAHFKFCEGKITVEVENAYRYGTGGVERLKNFTISFPYDMELLRIKKPQFFSLGDLVRLLVVAKKLGINTTPYVWELEKRVLISLFLLWIFAYGALNFFNTVFVRDIVFRVLLAAAFTIAFYLFIFIYQSLVFKISLNPWFALLITVPYLLLLMKSLKNS